MANKFYYNEQMEKIQYKDVDGFPISIDDVISWDLADRRSAQISLMNRLNAGFVVLREKVGVDEFLTGRILKYVNLSRSSLLNTEMSMRLANLHNEMAEYIIDKCKYINDMDKARKEISLAIGAHKFGVDFIYLYDHGFQYAADTLPEDAIEVYSTDYVYSGEEKDVDYKLFDKLSSIAVDYNMLPEVQYASVHEGLIYIYSMPDNPLLKDGVELLSKLSTNLS